MELGDGRQPAPGWVAAGSWSWAEDMAITGMKSRQTVANIENVLSRVTWTSGSTGLRPGGRDAGNTVEEIVRKLLEEWDA